MSRVEGAAAIADARVSCDRPGVCGLMTRTGNFGRNWTVEQADAHRLLAAEEGDPARGACSGRGVPLATIA
jgi:hypothetical protein